MRSTRWRGRTESAASAMLDHRSFGLIGVCSAILAGVHQCRRRLRFEQEARGSLRVGRDLPCTVHYVSAATPNLHSRGQGFGRHCGHPRMRGGQSRLFFLAVSPACRCDVAVSADMQLCPQGGAKMAIHASGILQDTPLLQMTPSRLRSVYAPKLPGTVGTVKVAPRDGGYRHGQLQPLEIVQDSRK